MIVLKKKRVQYLPRIFIGLFLICAFIVLNFTVFPEKTYGSDDFDGTIKHLIVVGDWQESEIADAIHDEYNGKDYSQHGWVDFDPNNPEGCIDSINGYLSGWANGDGESPTCAIVFFGCTDVMDDLEKITHEETEYYTSDVPLLNDDGAYVDEAGTLVEEPIYPTLSRTIVVVDHYPAPERIKMALNPAATQWTSKKAKLYWVGLTPDFGYDTDHYKDWDGDDSYGAWVGRWNSMIKSNLPSGFKFLDLSEVLAQGRPYWKSVSYNNENGKDVPVISSGIYHVGGYEHSIRVHSYTKETWQFIFHLVFNSILSDNPRKEDGDMVATDLYAVSSALTAYVNNVLGPNVDEKNKDHKIGKLKDSGDAGGMLGYGDEKNFDFVENYITNLSQTSSGVSYSALHVDDGNPNKALFDNALIYARYGRLLADTGLDQYGTPSTVGSPRWIPGGLLIVVFVFSAFCNKFINLMIVALRFVNPFQFLKDIDTFGHMFAGQGQMPGYRIIQKATELVSGVYDSLHKFSWTVTIPLFFAILIATLFLNTSLFNNNNRYVRGQKIRTFLLRVVFLGIGIPILGALYTKVLDDMYSLTGDSHCASTQIVCSTFVNFEEWAKQFRLNPSGGVYLKLSVDNTTQGGTASGPTIAKLRDTTLKINNMTGVVTADVSSSLSTTSGVIDWNINALKTDADNTAAAEAWNLLTGYIHGDFYYPSNWNSDVGSDFSNGGYTLGRRKGAMEEDFDKDALQGDNTVYQMFDKTNETKDWTDREVDDNQAILDGTDYSNFNIFSNGRSIGELNGKYEASDITVPKKGYKPSTKGGLSTLAMYNYLSSRFNEDGIVMYSNANSPNVQSKYSHFSVNLIGDGPLHTVYFLNIFSLLLVVSIVGGVYAFTTLINVVKKGLTVLMSIPGAALGILKSIATIISTVVVMAVEVVSVGFVYTLIAQLLTLFVNAIGKLLTSEGVVANGTTIIGGMVATFKQVPLIDAFLSSGFLAYGNLIFTTIVLFGLSYYTWKYGRAIVYSTNVVRNHVYDKYILPDELREVLDEKERTHVERPVSGLAWQFVYNIVILPIAGTAKILYNSLVNESVASTSSLLNVS